MTNDQMLDVVNTIRAQLQKTTCCADHALEVTLHLAASFAMDIAHDNRHQAAAGLQREVKEIANAVRTGKVEIKRRADA